MYEQCQQQLSCSCNNCEKKCFSTDSTVYNSEQCKYVQNSNYESNQPWTEEFGSNWHGCWKNCLSELEGDDHTCVDYYIKCQAQINQFQQQNLFVFAAIFIVLYMIIQ